MRQPLLILVYILLTACSEGTSLPVTHAAPADAAPIVHETELLRLTLTPESRRRLGIETVRISEQTSQAYRHIGGEIVVPPLMPIGIPTDSTANLQQLAGQQVAADAEVEKAQAQLDLARRILNRAQALMREKVGSQRASDEAVASFATAQAALVAAQQRRGLLGPSVDVLNRQDILWVRAPIFSTDLDAMQRDAPALIRPLGNRSRIIEARPASAPPSANSAAGTVDFYYELEEGEARFRVGQRVAVEIPIVGTVAGFGVPSSAIVRDIYGGEWVYQMTATDTYVRRRIEVATERNGLAILGRGLAVDNEIVTIGASELFGIEFGAAH